MSSQFPGFDVQPPAPPSGGSKPPLKVVGKGKAWGIGSVGAFVALFIGNAAGNAKSQDEIKQLRTASAIQQDSAVEMATTTVTASVTQTVRVTATRTIKLPGPTATVTKTVQIEVTPGNAYAAPSDSSGPSNGGSDENCTPGYDPCIPDLGTDVDCAGGSGNGPRYVDGPVYVTGSDPYGLDGNHDGVGCG